MSITSRFPIDAVHPSSEEEAVHLAQRLAAAPRPDALREIIADHCDDAVRLGVLHALVTSTAGPDERMRRRIARRREALLALDHAELHFTIAGRQADSQRDRQLCDAMCHCTKSARVQITREIVDLKQRHEEDSALRAELSRLTRKPA
ncbi:hypothetical protein [Sagittula sp. SSi028]|uniref:hypothetical protein n=1 Tax=Sagittula sp. SSi028 TaxID=3400636 RepID=UPI003AF61B63